MINTTIQKLKYTQLFLFNKYIEDKGTTATVEELSRYIDNCEILNSINWTYKDCQFILAAIIDAYEFEEGIYNHEQV